jgi:hypothetical protein
VDIITKFLSSISVFYNQAQRFADERSWRFRRRKLYASTEFDTKHKASFKHRIADFLLVLLTLCRFSFTYCLARPTSCNISFAFSNLSGNKTMLSYLFKDLSILTIGIFHTAINCNWKLNSKLLLDANPLLEILNHNHSNLNFHLEL